MNILVSIHCITYNHEKYIADAIDSFLMQKTNFKFEILIHDDASTDKTAEIIKKYEEKHPDMIRPIYQTENQYSKCESSVEQINLSRAVGKYIAICEGDDYWTDPYKLQKQVDYMESHPECSMCVHEAEVVDGRTGRKLGRANPYKKSQIVTTEEIIAGGGGIFATNSAMYLKDLMNNPPVFYSEAKIGDYPLFMALSLQGTIYYMNENMSSYRVMVQGSWTERNTTGPKRNEIRAENQDNDIWILKNFDEYSKGEYSSVVNNEIIKKELKKMIFLKSIQRIDKKDFIIKVSKFTLKEQNKMITKFLFRLFSRSLNNLMMRFNMKD